MTQREHMESEVQNYRESSLTKREFCQERGIKESTFEYWITRSNQKKKRGFLPLAEFPSGQASSLEIIYSNGVQIKVSAQW